MPEYHIKDGRTTVRFNQHTVSLQVFGAHNLQNLCAAKLVCQMLGMGEAEFLGAIGSFTGASRRLEKVFDIQGAAIFRDFAHAPSKVRASIGALREQFPDRTLIAVLELHTYSSLNAAFLSEYRHAMDQADTAAVFYSNHALEIKRLPPLSPALIRKGFDRKDLQVLENVGDLASFLAQQPTSNANLLMMSSGSFEATSIAKMTWLWQKN
jgi:UDP-N-acetylmuramate: L-alanyl-gamma-D-glutamyl-meso-diaminopimelate ligase